MKKSIVLLSLAAMSLLALTDEQMRIVAKSHKGYTLSGYEKGVYEALNANEVTEYKTKLDKDKEAQIKARQTAFEKDPANVQPMAEDNTPKGNLPTDESSRKNSGTMVSSGAKMAALGVVALPLSVLSGKVSDIPENVSNGVVAIGSGLAMMGKGAFDGAVDGVKSLFSFGKKEASGSVDDMNKSANIQ